MKGKNNKRTTGAGSHFHCTCVDGQSLPTEEHREEERPHTPNHWQKRVVGCGARLPPSTTRGEEEDGGRADVCVCVEKRGKARIAVVAVGLSTYSRSTRIVSGPSAIAASSSLFCTMAVANWNRRSFFFGFCGFSAGTASPPSSGDGAASPTEWVEV